MTYYILYTTYIIIYTYILFASSTCKQNFEMLQTVTKTLGKPFNFLQLSLMELVTIRLYSPSQRREALSGRKPGARVTNFALAVSKVVARGS